MARRSSRFSRLRTYRGNPLTTGQQVAIGAAAVTVLGLVGYYVYTTQISPQQQPSAGGGGGGGGAAPSGGGGGGGEQQTTLGPGGSTAPIGQAATYAPGDSSSYAPGYSAANPPPATYAGEV